MPYITTDEVKAIRQEIKKQFPDFKFSIRRENYSCVDVAILEGPVNLLENSERDHEQVNHFYITDHYPGPVADILNKITKIATANERELVHDSDYGSVPNFYFHLNIGQWDRPYKVR